MLIRLSIEAYDGLKVLEGPQFVGFDFGGVWVTTRERFLLAVRARPQKVVDTSGLLLE